MTAEDIDWEHEDLKKYRSVGMDDALRLCANLVDRFKRERAPMPIVVLSEAPATAGHGSPRQHDPLPASGNQVSIEDQVNLDSGFLTAIADIYADGGLLCQKFSGQDGQHNQGGPLPRPAGRLEKYHDALAMVRALSSATAWTNHNDSQYRPYKFPRSQLLAAIEEATAQASGDSGAARDWTANPDGIRPGVQSVLQTLGKKRWRPRRPEKGRWRPAVAPVSATATLLIGCLAAAETRVISSASLLLVLSSLVVIGAALTIQRYVALFSWLGAASRWFITTTFIGPTSYTRGAGRGHRRRLPHGPRRAWRIREARANLVIGQLITAYYAPADGAGREQALQFHLALRVHALLADLRANHHPWYPDLRNRKRTCPPMAFLADADHVLPDADQVTAGVALLQAVSDVRSRRSEMDPLLIVASSRSLRSLPGIAPIQGLTAPELYEHWANQVRVEQSPSRGSRWPWVLVYQIPATRLRAESGGLQPQPSADRSTLRFLWSRLTLAAAVAVLLVAGIVVNKYLYADKYCGAGLFDYDPNLITVGSECVGIDTTSTTQFVPADGGVTLSGKASGDPHVTNTTNIDLAGLEGLVRTQNENAGSGPHVTFVYAGALTAPSGSTEQPSTEPVSAVEELAGVYAWQYSINASANPVKIKIDIANDGFGSDQELAMADQVAGVARQDTTIVGVIGLGVDTSETGMALAQLAKAGLPVVDTTNSDDNFPAAWNYFGLSPTNSEEAEALAPYAGDGNGSYAAIFERTKSSTNAPDPYSTQQATAAETMLTKARFKLACGGPITYTTQSDLAHILSGLPDNAPGQGICGRQPSVIYLAGRHPDLPGVATLLKQSEKSFAPHVTVLSGDDMAVTEYPGTPATPLAPQMTLYFVAQTNPAYVGPNDSGVLQDNYSDLNLDMKNALSLTATPAYTNRIFADGLLALGFDAADALYQASTIDQNAQQVPLSRAAVTTTLRCQAPITHGAMGSIGFADVRHGLDFFEAKNNRDGETQTVTHLRHRQPGPGSCAPNVAS